MSLLIKEIKKPLTNFDLHIHNIKLEKGEIVGLIGPNGSGKSTLMKLLSRENETAECEAYWNGSTDFLSQLAYIPDTIRFSNMSVKDYVDLYGYYYQLDVEKLNRNLERFQLNLASNISKLSLGETQKLMFARVLAVDASLYLFDEPSDGYDPASMRVLKNDLMDMANDDTLVLIATHQIKAYEGILDRVLYIEDGRIIFNFTTIEIQEQAEQLLDYLFVPSEIKSEYSKRKDLNTFITCVERRMK